MHPAVQSTSNTYQDYGRHGRRRHLGHELPGAVEPDARARVAHAGAAAWTCGGPSAPAATAPGTWGRSTTTTPTPARPTRRTCSRRSKIGLSLAAFMLGMPTSVSIADNNGFDVRNNYFGTFVQDTLARRRGT